MTGTLMILLSDSVGEVNKSEKNTYFSITNLMGSFQGILLMIYFILSKLAATTNKIIKSCLHDFIKSFMALNDISHYQFC